MFNQSDKKEKIFVYLLSLTGFFLFLQITFFIHINSTYISDVSDISQRINIPVKVLPEIFLFLCIQLAIHLFYCALVYAAIMGITQLKTFTRINKFNYALTIWFVGIIWILICNQYFYPNSKYSELTKIIFFHPLVLSIAFYISSCVIIIVCTLACLGWWGHYKFLGACCGLILIVAYFYPHKISNPDFTPAKTQPNIFIIGIDSLRPDFIGYFSSPTTTPFLDNFLAKAAIFPQAVTELARTYPSWMSILGGKHPFTLGVRSNLSPSSSMDLSQTIGNVLRKHGYHTVFATDETRFSNIDKTYGFDQVITPKMGLNDFLLGTFNDFPISNLLINTRLGAILFPYSYANRGVFAFYNPNSFLTLINDQLENTSPLFLAIHFCLPHHPYVWAQLAADDITFLERYRASINRVDQQLADFFNILNERQLLNNAIVVILSDHGEALELRGDRITDDKLFSPLTQKAPKFYPQTLDDESFDQSAGHGTDVLGLPQYHTLLAFRSYGRQIIQPGFRQGTVTLSSIKPTLLEMLNIELENQDFSLSGSLTHNQPITPRHIFLESDFSPMAIRSVYPQVRAAMLEGAQLFEIDPQTLRLRVKPAMLNMIINSKQYANIYGDWMLAVYPQQHQQQTVVLINLVTGQWTTVLSSPLAKDSPATEMIEALKTFYGNELAHLFKPTH